jgi:hypothetical protein
MEPKGSLPRLQEPATCPYSEAEQSSPCPQISLPEDPTTTTTIIIIIIITAYLCFLLSYI